MTPPDAPTPGAPTPGAPTPAADAEVPVARIEDGPRWSWVWILPLLAAVLAAVLAWQAFGARGSAITIHLDEGHGLKPGAALRYRGIQVGEVSDVALFGETDGILVTVTLHDDGEDLARVGSRFWVVRPQVGWEGIGGLETLIGARYLAVLPGRGAPRGSFVGLEAPPLADALEPGLDLTLMAQRRSGLSPGSAVTFRQLRVGTVLSVGLASDGSGVLVGLRIRPEYAPLIREKTRFWSTSGLSLDVGITGLQLHLDTLSSLLSGGVALAVPPDAGEVARTGKRFTLLDAPEDDWLEWEPTVAVGHSLLPPGVVPPTPLRATLRWSESRLFTSFWTADEQRDGWVLLLADGLLGPTDLLTVPEDAHEGTAELQVAGDVLLLDPPAEPVVGGLSRLHRRPASTGFAVASTRSPDGPEDCLLVADPATEPLSLARSRFEVGEGGWQVDASQPLGTAWHGAAVVARADGALIGVLVVDDDDEAHVIPLPSHL